MSFDWTQAVLQASKIGLCQNWKWKQNWQIWKSKGVTRFVAYLRISTCSPSHKHHIQTAVLLLFVDNITPHIIHRLYIFSTYHLRIIDNICGFWMCADCSVYSLYHQMLWNVFVSRQWCLLHISFSCYWWCLWILTARILRRRLPIVWCLWRLWMMSVSRLWRLLHISSSYYW